MWSHTHTHTHSLSLSLSLSFTHTHTHHMYNVHSLCGLSCQINGLGPHQNTCTHVTTSLQHFYQEQECTSEAAQYKLLKEVYIIICTHTYAQASIHKNTCSYIQCYSLSLSCIYTHTDHHVHIPSHGHSWHVHTFTSVDLCVLEADWRHCIGLTEAGLSSSRCQQDIGEEESRDAGGFLQSN